MKEVIYTIPVNEAFDAQEEKCPFCALYDKLQSNELDLILGASMMEPDVRLKTNEKGFCPEHFAMMFARNNRLQLALMLESHLDAVGEGIKQGGFLSRDASQKTTSYIDKLGKSCYVCERIDFSLGKMFETAAVLWSREKDFRAKFSKQKFFCLEHYRLLLETARRELPKQTFSELADEAARIEKAYLSELRGDVSHFIKKYDYRYEDEPWGNSKDSVERALRFISGSSLR